MDSNTMSPVSLYGVSLVAQMVKNLPAVQEAWLWSLGREDSLKKGMATHSSILAWRIPWTEEAGRLESMGLQRIRHYWVTHIFTFSVSLKEAEIRTQIHTEASHMKTLKEDGRLQTKGALLEETSPVGILIWDF